MDEIPRHSQAKVLELAEAILDLEMGEEHILDLPCGERIWKRIK